MKLYILAAILITPLFFSNCTKTKYVDKIVRDTDTVVNTITKHDTITTIKHDTVLHYSNNSLIGGWHNGSNTIVFSQYTYKLNGAANETYLATSDSIYHYYLDKSAGAWYGYTISRTNDTLTLWPVVLSPSAPYIYFRD